MTKLHLLIRHTIAKLDLPVELFNSEFWVLAVILAFFDLASKLNALRIKFYGLYEINLRNDDLLQF